MADRKPRLLFYFLHLLGVGHVYRAKRLIEAFDGQGIAVDIIYGGMPLDGINFAAEYIHYLPPIRTQDASYKRMVDSDGKAISQDYMKRRKIALLDIFAGLKADAILTEAFPFGRRIVRQEVDALLTAATKRSKPPLIISSVRDILQENRKPGRIEDARNWVLDRFDHVLVHSDPNVIRLDATFPLAQDIQEKVVYTGFVVPPARQSGIAAVFDVIVSAGGGGFGQKLMRVALKLANDDRARRWCLALGPNLPTNAASELRQNAASHVAIVERLDDLAEHMKHAMLSISQCGYNTAMDVLAAHEESGCRAVLVPYDTTGQTEQLRRAELLEKAGYAVYVPQSQLTSQRLKEAVERAQGMPKVEKKIDFGGAANSAKLLLRWTGARA